ncbi:MAG: nucleotide excision repair endonuclease [Bdellovibrionia bacterium]
MSEQVQPQQQRLFAYDNPLKKRFEKEFFAGIPKLPGIYIFRGSIGEILYIGKAKDLRARLRSYPRARPENVSRKVIRMLHLVRTIEWEICESEEAALLRENELLRTKQPPFNVVNTHPESYYFITIEKTSSSFLFRLTTDPSVLIHAEDSKTSSSLTNVFGAFKGRGSVREGYSALLRLLWAAHYPEDAGDRFEFPSSLNPNRRTGLPYRFELDTLKPENVRTERLIRRFLAGTSRSLLTHLTAQLLANERIPRFIYRCIQEDLETLEAFYHRGPHRNRRLKRHHRLAAHQVIPQERLDDLIVGYRFQR